MLLFRTDNLFPSTCQLKNSAYDRKSCYKGEKGDFFMWLDEQKTRYFIYFLLAILFSIMISIGVYVLIGDRDVPVIPPQPVQDSLTGPVENQVDELIQGIKFVIGGKTVSSGN